MTAETRFGSVLTAMVTPFNSDGLLDIESAQHLAQYLVENGNDGVVVAGTTGESPTISAAEQKDLFKAVKEALPNNAVIAGVGSNDTASAVKNTKNAVMAGVDGLLVVTPYYNRPSQAGIHNYFATVASASDLPVMVYDIPVRTGRKIETENIIKLAEIDNIIALKDASGDPGETSRLIAEIGDDLQIYSGDDLLNLPLLSIGAVGVVSVAGHWAGPELAEMVQAYKTGDVDKAAKLHRLLLPSFNYETSLEAPNPVPSKVMMNLLGISVGECRPPMGPIPEGLELQAKEVLKGLGRS